MTTRSEQLADQFAKANDEFITLIERLDDGQWRARCPSEGWTVGQAACHIADDHAGLADLVKIVADGNPLPDFTLDWLNQFNADQAARNANCTKEHVLQLLRTNGAAAEAFIRGLTDAQLDTAITLSASHAFVSEGLPERLTTSVTIEAGLIGHFREHGPSILAALFPAPAPPAHPVATVS